ncbi:MAG: hypothetical protein H7641_09455, partial [Candidatus Heimdallarchaeota archaeon]|nr:hypothetical protein [Candidatus Heimdallarchaeota archaeon]MCK4877790.1 hypothetical protein [Candidatus Heimdallarchaeota archaeon]
MNFSCKFRIALFFFIVFSLVAVVLIPVVSNNHLGDAYANSVVTGYSHYYSNGDNAIGPPDGNYATISFSYSIGYLTLDMGENESIIDGEGDDFLVIAQGNYTIWVENYLSQPMVMLSIGLNNRSYDLTTTEFNEVRYIRIEYGGGVSVLLDAIEAFNYNIPEDIEPTTPVSVGSFF